MTTIGFFSDDAAGPLCARLAALGLASLGGQVTLALSGAAAWQVGGRQAAGVARHALPDVPGTRELDQMLAANRDGGDAVVALPLDAVRDGELRCLFDAVVTVGDAPAAAARALRAARYDAGVAGRRRSGDEPREVPAWFLAAAGQSELMTMARLSAGTGPRLPFATRTLPMVLPGAARRGATDMEGAEADSALLGTGLLLGALSLAIAADPTTDRLEASDLVAMMAARDLGTDRRLAERLRGLAEAYESLGRVGTAPEAVRQGPAAHARRPRTAKATTPGAGRRQPATDLRARV